MNPEIVAKHLIELAKELCASDAEQKKFLASTANRRALADALLASVEARDYVTAEELAVLCPGAAKRAVAKGMTRINKSAIVQAGMTQEQRLEKAKTAGKKDPAAFVEWLGIMTAKK